MIRNKIRSPLNKLVVAIAFFWTVYVICLQLYKLHSGQHSLLHLADDNGGLHWGVVPEMEEEEAEEEKEEENEEEMKEEEKGGGEEEGRIMDAVFTYVNGR